MNSYTLKPFRRAAFHSIRFISHPRRRVTQKTLRKKYVSSVMNNDVVHWARNCLACQRMMIPRHNHLTPTLIDTPDARFNRINLNIIVMPTIDRFSRWPVAVRWKDNGNHHHSAIHSWDRTLRIATYNHNRSMNTVRIETISRIITVYRSQQNQSYSILPVFQWHDRKMAQVPKDRSNVQNWNIMDWSSATSVLGTTYVLQGGSESISYL